MRSEVKAGEFYHSKHFRAVAKVIEIERLWGHDYVRIWLPNADALVRVPIADLSPLNSQTSVLSSDHIAYVAAAAKVANVLEGPVSTNDGHVLLAPMESSVIPLPHQIHALSRAISGSRVRYLLADEVGLGKTVEAGLILRELKLRGLVGRTLVVAPKGLATQWVAEMQIHFNEHFQLVLGDDFGTLKRMAPGNERRNSVWTMFDQVIVSFDSVKPMTGRRGWTDERVHEYNRDRFEDLITAGWDLIIVDEGHRLGGSSDQVARYKLGRGLAEAAPYMLLLSATPHQGKTDAFHRLMNLLDDEAFPDTESMSRERVAPYIIRTEKRKAIDTDGNPLFQSRRTQMAPVAWESRHQLQKLLYETVTDYVREGYNQAMREKKRHIGFLMILMQRLVVSSTRAIRTTLERRLAALQLGEQQARMRLADIENNADRFASSEELYDMDSQELLDELLKSHVSALQSEGSHVQTLLDAAIRCEQAGPDAKAESLLEWIYWLQAEENDPDLKVLVFTEFVPTQKMLTEFMEARGISAVTLNGTMNMEERQKAQDAFRDSHRIMVSTDAGGEGLNLQFAHVVINYDLPWNPMRLEQRIGRVDRIGQPKTVWAINFVFEESVEFRVREVLEQKLSVIFDQFGIDKTGDVLDSAQACELFEDMFTSAIINPDEIETSVQDTVDRIRNEIQCVHESSPIYGISQEPDLDTAERLRSHPLPHWVERMTVGYLNSHGGSATRKRSWWDLWWPDGYEQRKCVFSAQEADRLTKATLLNLENNRIRGLALSLPQMVPGQPLPWATIDGLPSTITGYWGLFEIRLQAGIHQYSHMLWPTQQNDHVLRIPLLRRGYFSVFVSDEGKLFLPTARHIWDQIVSSDLPEISLADANSSTDVYERLEQSAEQAGQEHFEALKQAHLAAITREEERGTIAFASRRKAIERVGLPEVRQYRLARCDAEETMWRKELQSARQIVPEIRSLLILKIAGNA